MHAPTGAGIRMRNSVLRESRAFARFLRPLELSSDATAGSIRLVPGILSPRWMQTSQPRAFTRRLRPTGDLSLLPPPTEVQKRADRFLPQPPLRKFRNFRLKKKNVPSTYLPRAKRR